MVPKISAYIPCLNCAATIGQTIQSLLSQTIPVDEIFVLDDGSTDNSREVALQLKVRLIANSRTEGRGAVRARAMTEASNELVLACDAGKNLAPDFCRQALAWMRSPNTVAAFGVVHQSQAKNAVDRWRGRHLYKTNAQQSVNRRASLITGGVMMRRSAVLSAGNFDARARHSEDLELGQRLLDLGYDIVSDPNMIIWSDHHNTLRQVLDRHRRWYAGTNDFMGWRAYLKDCVYSARVMARQDLKERDGLAALISLISPHYRFWMSRLSPL